MVTITTTTPDPTTTPDITTTTMITTTTTVPNAASTLALTTMQATTTNPLTSLLNTTSMLTANYTTSTLLYCPEPKPLAAGGAIISIGPYIANITQVVYNCFNGYSINGPATMLCSANGTWDLDPPQCVPISNNPHVDNHITVQDHVEAIPFWLLIVMSVAFGMLALLLLTCCVLLCLKAFGCLKGGCFRKKERVITPVKSRSEASTNVVIDDYDKPAYTEKTPAYSPRRSVIVKPTRKEAVMPANTVWMPHSNPIRSNNTSTK